MMWIAIIQISKIRQHTRISVWPVGNSRELLLNIFPTQNETCIYLDWHCIDDVAYWLARFHALIIRESVRESPALCSGLFPRLSAHTEISNTFWPALRWLAPMKSKDQFYNRKKSIDTPAESERVSPVVDDLLIWCAKLSWWSVPSGRDAFDY